MESSNDYVDNIFANELLSCTILSSAIFVFIFSCLWLICGGLNDGHFDQLEDHDTANGAFLLLVSLIVCISSFAGLAAYLQHGATILKRASEISSDDVCVSAIAVLLIALSIFVLIAEFQKRGAFLPVLRPMEEQVEVAPLEIAAEDFVLHCAVNGLAVEGITRRLGVSFAGSHDPC
jgi:L-asparagine transporter-like permease